jgi:diguanylate cyclase (GGDEF)-like protein/PAS domain S-box-containing protein
MSEFDTPEIFRNVLESLQTGVYLVDRDQRILFWNEGAEKITGYFRQDVIGRFCRENSAAEVDGNKIILPDAADAIVSVLHDGKPTILEISLRHKAGHRISIRLRAAPIRNGHRTVIGVAVSFDEGLSASDWDRRQSKLAGHGCLDAATGVLTQAFTLSQLREKLAVFGEHQMPFSVLYIEIDRIDHLRASYGQAVLAPVLRVVGQTLENGLRPTDFLGRFGEYRFLAILTECGSEDVERAAERIMKMVNAAEVEWWGDRWSVTASFGATTVTMGDTVESISERAQRSLDESIAAGGNRVTLTTA